MPEIAIFFIFVIAMFVQTSAGFGSALIAMPLMVGLIGTRTAAPLFALSFVCISVVITYRYRHDLQFKNFWRLLLAGLLAIPIGVNIISQWDERVTLFAYGLFVIAYALYALLGFQPPRLKGRHWQFGLGFIAGMVSGAYNTSGPVYVIYGDSQRWSPFEFKGNLQALFFINSIFTTINHFIAGNVTPQVLHLWVYAIPGLIVGIGLGFAMDKYIQPEPFRKVVQVLLLIIGVGLILR